MEKNWWLIIFLVLLIVPFAFAGTAELSGKVISGDAISLEVISGDVTVEVSGKATQTTSVSITVGGALPTVNLIAPVNGTYFQNSSIPLTFDFTSTSPEFKFNLNDGTNTTIIGSTNFSSPEGSIFLTLFINDSFGSSLDNVTFFVNLTAITISFGEYTGPRSGASTDITQFTLAQLEVLNLTLENTDYAKIIFLPLINFTNDEDPTDTLVNLSFYTNISLKTIEINSTGLPNFNISAALSFYNITFVNPLLLRDGVACSTALCEEISFVSETFLVKVTGFTTYTVVEGGVPTPTPEAGETGVSGDATGRKSKFLMTPAELSTKLLRGEIDLQTVSLDNKGDQQLSIHLTVSENIERFVTLPNGDNYPVPSGQKVEVPIQFTAAENETLGVYTGTLLAKARELQQVTKLIIEVESAIIAYDLNVAVPDRYREIQPGATIPLEITINNSERQGTGIIEYILKDLANNVWFIFSEPIQIEDQTFIKQLTLPEFLPEAEYLLHIQVRFEDTLAVDSVPLLSVVLGAPALPPTDNKPLAITLSIILVLILTWFLLSKVVKAKIVKNINKFFY